MMIYRRMVFMTSILVLTYRSSVKAKICSQKSDSQRLVYFFKTLYLQKLQHIISNFILP